MRHLYIFFFFFFLFHNYLFSQTDPYKWDRLPSNAEITKAVKKLRNDLEEDISVNGKVVDKRSVRLSSPVKFHDKKKAGKISPENISRCIIWAEIHGITGTSLKEYNLFQKNNRFNFAPNAWGTPGNNLNEQYSNFIASLNDNGLAPGFAPPLPGSKKKAVKKSKKEVRKKEVRNDPAQITDEDDEGSSWTVIIGAITAAALLLIRNRRKKIKAKRKTDQDDHKKEKETSDYILQLNSESFRLNLKEPQELVVKVWKVSSKGRSLVNAGIKIQNSEKALKIKPKSSKNTLKSQLILEKEPKQPQFTIAVLATAGGKTYQKYITINTKGEKEIQIRTLPDDSRYIRPDTGQTLTCYAKVVDEMGKDLDLLTKKIKFDGTFTNWIDLSEPVWNDGWVAINIQVSDPDATAAVSHPPESVTLGISVVFDENGSDRRIENNLVLQLLDCKIDTSIDSVSFPVSDKKTEVSFKVYIKDCNGSDSWNFKAGYKTNGYELDNKPLSLIDISPVSATEAKITLTGPVRSPEGNEQFLRKMLLIEASQKDEETLKREIYVMVSKEGLFINRGVDQKQEISFVAKGDYIHEIDMALYVYDEETGQIVVDKKGLQSIDFELINKENKYKNIVSVLQPEFIFDDFTTTVPFARYILSVPNKFPGFGNNYKLKYRVSVLYSQYSKSQSFEQIITLNVQDFGIGEKYPDWQKAYDQCKYTILEYIPDSDKRHDLLALLEKNKYKMDIEGMVAFRKKIWMVAHDLMINKAEGYLVLANWYQAIEDTLKWVVWMGDIAFQVVLATYTGVGASLLISTFKETFLTGVRLAIEGKSVDDFVDEQIEAMKQMMYSTAKGSVINTRTIEKFYKGNKLKVWAIYAVATFAVQYQRLGSVPQAAKETARQLRDEAIISFLHGKVTVQREEQANLRKENIPEGYERSHEPPDVSGYTDTSMKSIQRIANKYKVKIITRPTNAAARKFLKSGKAVPKKMFVKNKTINEWDTYLGAKKENIGIVGSFKPKLNKSQLKGLPESTVRKIVDRYKQRRREWVNQAKHLKENAKNLYVKDGLVYDAKSHKPFTGDVDIYDIRGPKGEKLSPKKYEKVVRELIRSGTNIEHGAHMRWKWWEKGNRQERTVNKGIYKKIVDSHKKKIPTKDGDNRKGESLTEFLPGTSGGVKFRGIYHK